MKNLALKFDGMKNMLTREQMKKLNGGMEEPTTTSGGSSGDGSFASCHAKCNVPAKGVTCTGSACSADDYWACWGITNKYCKS